jgi:hypothetical protein
VAIPVTRLLENSEAGLHHAVRVVMSGSLSDQTDRPENQ